MRTLDEQSRQNSDPIAYVRAYVYEIDKPDVWARADEDALRLARYFAN